MNKITPETEKKVLEIYGNQAKKNIAEVARLACISEPTIRKIIRKVAKPETSETSETPEKLPQATPPPPAPTPAPVPPAPPGNENFNSQEYILPQGDVDMQGAGQGQPVDYEKIISELEKRLAEKDKEKQRIERENQERTNQCVGVECAKVAEKYERQQKEILTERDALRAEIEDLTKAEAENPPPKAQAPPAKPPAPPSSVPLPDEAPGGEAPPEGQETPPDERYEPVPCPACKYPVQYPDSFCRGCGNTLKWPGEKPCPSCQVPIPEGATGTTSVCPNCGKKVKWVPE